MVVVNVREACGFVRSMCYHSCLLFLRGSFPSCSIKRLLVVSVVLIVTTCSLAVFRFVLSQDLCK